MTPLYVGAIWCFLRGYTFTSFLKAYKKWKWVVAASSLYEFTLNDGAIIFYFLFLFIGFFLRELYYFYSIKSQYQYWSL